VPSEDAWSVQSVLFCPTDGEVDDVRQRQG
jgi:hypothetical protein